jgi:hypothetical protein
MIMKSLIPNYRNIPGQHCGTTAMRNLLYHYCGLDLSEETVFGLGSGIDFMFIKIKGLEPAAVIFGRSITMELDAAQALGIDYREQPEMDNHKAWADVRNEVLEGRPTMLTGDIFFLDYRSFKVRFPAHRFVLVGFDDEKQIAYVADRILPEPQACSYKALDISRNPSTGITTYNLWGKFFDTKVSRTVEQAAALALSKTANRMTGRDTSQMDLLKSATPKDAYITAGIAGLTDFAKNLKSWHEREDSAKIASYVSQAIEKFGTGGGNFRKMFAAFLNWASGVLPDIVTPRLVTLANLSADKWSDLARLLEKASTAPDSIEVWNQAGEKADEIYDIESELFDKLCCENNLKGHFS